MPLDPTFPAASLISQRELTPAERQNQYGIARQVIQAVTPGKHVTILAVQTPQALTPEQFCGLDEYLKQHYDVEAMQTSFACTVPNFGNEYRNDLHLQAHLRAELETVDR